MNLEKFLKKHGYTLESDEVAFAQRGIELMRTSLDRHHEDTHIYRMLQNFPNFTEDYPNMHIPSAIISICWHDVWKSRQRFSSSVIKFWFDQLNDGLGSALMFARASGDLSWEVRKKAGIAILLHQRADVLLPSMIRYHYVSRLTPEAKLLQDLDALESCNLAFFNNFVNVYDDRFRNYPHFVDVWSRYYWRGFTRMNENYLHSDTAKGQFADAVDPFREAAEAYLEKIAEY